MENIRAFGVLNTIENMADIVKYGAYDLDDEKVRKKSRQTALSL